MPAHFRNIYEMENENCGIGGGLGVVGCVGLAGTVRFGASWLALAGVGRRGNRLGLSVLLAKRNDLQSRP